MRGIPREVLRGVTFHVKPGEAYGLVGESGCGKSTTAYAALRYMPSNGLITGGRILVGGQDVTRMSDKELRRFRAHQASMVYQDPGSALNPTVKIGRQVAEAFTILGHDRGDALNEARDALRRVRIADPDRVMQRYPHQLSGGMQQRVVIAMALACDPTAARARRADHRPRRHRRGRGPRPRRARCATRPTRRSCSSPTTSA